MSEQCTGPTIEWVIATKFHRMEDYGIMPAPVVENDEITADNPMDVKR